MYNILYSSICSVLTCLTGISGMSSVHGDSVFLIRTLEKILSDKETKRSQHQQLKKACEEALSKLFILMTTPTTHNNE